MNGSLLRVLDMLVHEVRRGDGEEFWYKLRHDMSPKLKSDIQTYVREYNKLHKTRLSVSFTNAYRMRVRENQPGPKTGGRR